MYKTPTLSSHDSKVGIPNINPQLSYSFNSKKKIEFTINRDVDSGSHGCSGFRFLQYCFQNIFSNQSISRS